MTLVVLLLLGLAVAVMAWRFLWRLAAWLVGIGLVLAAVGWGFGVVEQGVQSWFGSIASHLGA